PPSPAGHRSRGATSVTTEKPPANVITGPIGTERESAWRGADESASVAANEPNDSDPAHVSNARRADSRSAGDMNPAVTPTAPDVPLVFQRSAPARLPSRVNEPTQRDTTTR